MSPKSPLIRADDADEAITTDEIHGEAVSPENESPVVRNAFTELMTTAAKPLPAKIMLKPGAKRKAETENTNQGIPAPTVRVLKNKPFDARHGLLVYIEHPEKNPEGRVVEYDDEFVVIRDKYPKAAVHMLLLPRDPDLYNEHPLKALSNNLEFLAKVKTRVERLRILAANELRRQFGQHSASDASYQTALEELMSSPEPPPPHEREALLPPGRDWLREIKAGVHTHPSMNHLHVHIISRELSGPSMKKKNHYLSFQTSFLVEMKDLPLEEDSGRYHPGKWVNWDMICWRCGLNFKNRFAELKRHLEDETQIWKRE